MAPQVNISRVLSKLRTIPPDQVRQELAAAFTEEDEVTAFDVLQGFEADQRCKLVLAVETMGRPQPATQAAAGHAVCRLHVVKLGWESAVAGDYDRWAQCCRDRKISMRMFVPLRRCALPPVDGQPRAAVVYEDASQLFGPLHDGESVTTLADAFQKAIFNHGAGAANDGVCPASVERIFRQTYAELGRWFYQPGRLQGERGQRFFRNKLRLDRDVQASVFAMWEQGILRELRGDAIWLLFDQRRPDVQQQPDYVDPVEYLSWAFDPGRPERVPEVAVGASHGDFHGFNVLLGISRREAEYPVIIDYGDMSATNAIVWDFVKMETELKVRVLDDLFVDGPTRREVLSLAALPHHQRLVARWADTNPMCARHERARRVLFAFLFEKLLALRAEAQAPTDALDTPIAVGAGPPPLARALRLLARIRTEAAYHLRRLGRAWDEEYDFALACYGVSTAKYDDFAYSEHQRIFALVSAGAAIGRLQSAQRVMAKLLDEPGLGATGEPATLAFPELPSFVVPLKHGYLSWARHRNLDAAQAVLKRAGERFSHAVPIARELALLLAANGEADQALAVLTELVSRHGGRQSPYPLVALIELCEPFGDYETLSRLGRIYKDLGDTAWKNTRPLLPFERLDEIAARQFYRAAYDCYAAAFRFSRDHFPGGNAAVTALLAGLLDQARSLADEVAGICRELPLVQFTADDQYWILSTEATMALLSRDARKAVNFCQQAHARLPKEKVGYVQSSYDQIGRLYHALGPAKVLPVAKAIVKSHGKSLKPAPLGDCGGLLKKSRTATRRPKRHD